MESETTVVWLALGMGLVVLWALFHGDGPKQEKPREEILGADGRPDPFLEAIDAERKDLLRNVAETLDQQHRASLNELTSSDMQVMGRLKKFAASSGLDKALRTVHDAIGSAPYSGLQALGAEQVEDEKLPEGWGVKFIFEGARFSIRTTRNIREVTIAVFENEEEMFAMSSFSNFEYMDVVAFKKRGTWASMLQKMESRKTLSLYQSNSRGYTEDAKRSASRFAE